MIPFAPLLLRAAPYLIGAAVIVGAYHMTPVIGPAARIDRIADDRDAWRTAAGQWEDNAKGWKASFREAERLRGVESKAAVAAVNTEQKSCDARVAEARRSSKAIERLITHEPPKPDARGCPGRALLDANELRDALQAPGH